MRRFHVDASATACAPAAGDQHLARGRPRSSRRGGTDSIVRAASLEGRALRVVPMPGHAMQRRTAASRDGARDATPRPARSPPAGCAQRLSSGCGSWRRKEACRGLGFTRLNATSARALGHPCLRAGDGLVGACVLMCFFTGVQVPWPTQWHRVEAATTRREETRVPRLHGACRVYGTLTLRCSVRGRCCVFPGAFDVRKWS